MPISGTAVRLPTKIVPLQLTTVQDSDDAPNNFLLVAPNNNRVELIIQNLVNPASALPLSSIVQISNAPPTGGAGTGPGTAGIVVKPGETIVIDKGAQRSVYINNEFLGDVLVQVSEVVFA